MSAFSLDCGIAFLSAEVLCAVEQFPVILHVLPTKQVLVP